MVTVRCPACLATYNLDPAKVGADLATVGKKMKCAKCGTIWLAKPESAETLAAEAAAQAAAQAEAEAAAAAAAAPPTPETPSEPVSAPLPEDATLSQGPTLESMAQTRGVLGRWLRGENRWMIGAVLFLILGIVMVAAVVGHHFSGGDVRDTLPLDVPIAPAAVKKPLTTVQPPAGVLLRRVRSEVADIDGGVLLTVRGLVTNTSSASVVLPPLMLQLLSADGKVQDMWPVSSISGTLPAQAENAWVVSLTEPSLDAVKGWRMVFTDSQP